MALSLNHPSPHVALVTFSEKTSRDTFSSGTIEDVVSTIDGLIEEPNTNAVVLTGTGKFFSAGGPVDKFDEAIDAGVIRGLVESMTGHLHPLLLRMRRTPTVFVRCDERCCCRRGFGACIEY